MILLGIMCAEDAELAVKYGCDAIWISNHGAR
jgi:isopentenyl diphosphate isomerase/L-lactate dehydrogenase-like FMN-dependent dehydrogenase